LPSGWNPNLNALDNFVIGGVRFIFWMSITLKGAGIRGLISAHLAGMRLFFIARLAWNYTAYRVLWDFTPVQTF